MNNLTEQEIKEEYERRLQVSKSASKLFLIILISSAMVCFALILYLNFSCIGAKSWLCSNNIFFIPLLPFIGLILSSIFDNKMKLQCPSCEKLLNIDSQIKYCLHCGIKLSD